MKIKILKDFAAVLAERYGLDHEYEVKEAVIDVNRQMIDFLYIDPKECFDVKKASLKVKDNDGLLIGDAAYYSDLQSF